MANFWVRKLLSPWPAISCAYQLRVRDFAASPVPSGTVSNGTIRTRAVQVLRQASSFLPAGAHVPANGRRTAHVRYVRNGCALRRVPTEPYGEPPAVGSSVIVRSSSAKSQRLEGSINGCGWLIVRHGLPRLNAYTHPSLEFVWLSCDIISCRIVTIV